MAKNSARPRYGFSYDDSAPVLSRSLRPPPPRTFHDLGSRHSKRITGVPIRYDDANRTAVLAAVLGKTAPKHGSKPARENLHVSHAPSAPSFSPYRPFGTTNRRISKKELRSPTHERTENMSNSGEQTFDEFLRKTDLNSWDRNYMKWYGSIVIKPGGSSDPFSFTLVVYLTDLTKSGPGFVMFSSGAKSGRPSVSPRLCLVPSHFMKTTD